MNSSAVPLVSKGIQNAIKMTVQLGTPLDAALDATKSLYPHEEAVQNLDDNGLLKILAVVIYPSEETVNLGTETYELSRYRQPISCE